MTEPQGRIVVGVDGSPASQEALKWAVRQSRLTNAAVEAVLAWQYPMSFGGFPLGSEEDWTTNGRTVLDTAVDQALGADGASVTRTFLQGHPAKMLLDTAAGADLLVVGNRGHGGFVGMLLGSVSEKVVAHARCPVLVVHHSAAA